jgi:hypothetical protein
MKNIRLTKDKVPLFHQLPIITNNLEQKLNRSVKIGIEVWKHDHTDENNFSFRISIIPGLDEADCTSFEYKKWENLLTQYRFLMEKEGE